MYLGITLSRLEDHENAFLAYEKALALDGTDFLCLLNYAIALLKGGVRDKAAAMIKSVTCLPLLDSRERSSVTPLLFRLQVCPRAVRRIGREAAECRSIRAARDAPGGTATRIVRRFLLDNRSSGQRSRL